MNKQLSPTPSNGNDGGVIWKITSLTQVEPELVELIIVLTISMYAGDFDYGICDVPYYESGNDGIYAILDLVFNVALYFQILLLLLVSSMKKSLFLSSCYLLASLFLHFILLVRFWYISLNIQPIFNIFSSKFIIYLILFLQSQFKKQKVNSFVKDYIHM
jgi:phage shock protein PspC (stress-responsive transcriptional regulator)